VISTGNNPARWAPKNQRLHRVLCRANGVTIDEACREAIELLRAPTSAVVKRQPADLAVI